MGVARVQPADQRILRTHLKRTEGEYDVCTFYLRTGQCTLQLKQKLIWQSDCQISLMKHKVIRF
ncbi:hypothetical protein D3C73_1022760 [compost metagenome]